MAILLPFGALLLLSFYPAPSLCLWASYSCISAYVNPISPETSLLTIHRFSEYSMKFSIGSITEAASGYTPVAFDVKAIFKHLHWYPERRSYPTSSMFPIWTCLPLMPTSFGSMYAELLSKDVFTRHFGIHGLDPNTEYTIAISATCQTYFFDYTGSLWRVI